MNAGGEARPALDRPLLGAFAPLRVLARAEPGERRHLLGTVAGAGLTTLLTEGVDLPPWLASEARGAGLRLGGGIACFSDHAGGFRPVPESLRPVAPDGGVRPQMEWYRGVIPTDPAYVEDLVAACARAAADPSLDLFVLDFIRWPLHWELELRAGATPVDASFDALTLARFRDEMAVDIPVDDPRAAAARIAAGLEDAWAAFKCRVITAVVERVVAAVRAVRPELPIGAFIVPGTDDERRRWAGQDIAEFGTRLDALLPMTYHAILGRPPRWVGDVVGDLRARAGAPVVPVVQATADRAVAGSSDWGDPFAPEVLGMAIDSGLEAGGTGFVVFPAHGLDEARAAAVARRASAAGAG